MVRLVASQYGVRMATVFLFLFSFCFQCSEIEMKKALQGHHGDYEGSVEITPEIQEDLK